MARLEPFQQSRSFVTLAVFCHDWIVHDVQCQGTDKVRGGFNFNHLWLVWLVCYWSSLFLFLSVVLQQKLLLL